MPNYEDKDVANCTGSRFCSIFLVHVVLTHDDCTLGYAVRGFFQNGGSRCFVIVVWI